MAKTDSELVDQTLAGERSAFGTLYDRYAPVVRAYCYAATHQFEGAQDLAQEVFLRAYRDLGRLREPEKFGRWLIGIARMVCREWRRGEGRKRTLLTSVESTAHAQSSDDPAPGGTEELGRALAALPERERLAVHAFYLDGRDVERARALLGVSRSGFYLILTRARKRLKRLLKGEP